MDSTIMPSSSPEAQSGTERPSSANQQFAPPLRAISKRAMPLPRSGRARIRQNATRLLEIGASIGLSLLITVGFVAALGLSSPHPWFRPWEIHMYEGLFVWCWVILSCASWPRS
jgi:hypothetical protein